MNGKRRDRRLTDGGWGVGGSGGGGGRRIEGGGGYKGWSGRRAKGVVLGGVV